ncbi:hypothetical protein [Flavipsychrobacter stenotrophus]|nr:hypothetical protein [Flavipsychrobacter stenotrophus]
MKSRLVVFLFAFISIYIFFNREEWKGNMYGYDVDGYYMYLPATFLYHDLGKMGFHKQAEADFGVSPDTYYVFDQPQTGRRTNMYAIGTSLFELPCFLIAWAWSDNVAGYNPDGYSVPFQIAGRLSNILWVMLGLFVLRRFLKVYFTDTVTAIVLACIAFGTNLYTYSTFIPGMSHPYVFVILSCILYYTQRWYAQGKPSQLYMLGALAGLAVITRPIAIIIFLITLLWEVNSLESLKLRLSYLAKQSKHIAIAMICFLAVAMIQMSYWKYTSGHWIFFSYQNDGFNFLKPKIWAGLFSYQKGWFVYTPMALLGIAGLFFLWKKQKTLASAFILYFIIIIYVVFSWRNWWYGGGFSARGMVESLAVMALPLGALAERVLSLKKKVLTGAMLVVFSCLITLNMFQSYQYGLFILHADRMSKAFYWKIFGKTKIDNAQVDKYLMPEHNLNEEIKERFDRK